MNDDRFNESPREELDDALRQAVDRVRSQPVAGRVAAPLAGQGAEDRRRPAPPWRGVGRRVLALAALVGLILFCGEMLRQKPESVAKAERAAKIQELRNRLEELRREIPAKDVDFTGDDEVRKLKEIKVLRRSTISKTKKSVTRRR